ncbi:MAG: WD40/YVTN/BNR-like repeat-containing protein [Planctomycetota bacterium]|jgi:hypothetical protein
METRKILVMFFLALCLLVWPGQVSQATPMGTAFTYQGRLIDANQPADGLYDVEFKLYDAVTDGNQIGGAIDVNEISVIDGYFTAQLDFGSDVFDRSAVWLEVGVRPGVSTGSFTTLAPRQEVTPTPYALRTRGIFIDDLPYIYYPDTWTAKESTRQWRSVAMSADGQIQTAVAWQDQIYVSTDSGNTWTAKDSSRIWHSVAMSADGQIQTAVEINGQIYVSTDYGNTWTVKESNRVWSSVAMSADGVVQTAVVSPGQIYVSIDSGNTWTAKESNRAWLSVAMSADGSLQTAVASSDQIYVSTDSGNTWTAKESNRFWESVAMSSDGTVQTAVENNGQIYVSTDYGNTWTAKESTRQWQSVAMSADGTKQTAVVRFGQVYVSTNSGNTWAAKESNRDWTSVAMSADGTKQTAVAYNGQIYVCSADVSVTHNVGIGTTNPTSRLTVKGNILVQSEATGADVAEIGEGLDYAEGFDVTDRDAVKPGTVLVIDPECPGKLTVSGEAYDRTVAGIAAGGKGLASGVRLGVDQFDCDVALAGRVYCNVDASIAAIKPGDLLTTSNTPGYAMKVTDYSRAQGAILGKAMSSLNEGKGLVLVLVTLQ